MRTSHKKMRRGARTFESVTKEGTIGLDSFRVYHSDGRPAQARRSCRDVPRPALEQRRDKTRALTHGMMQNLLTGRIRLV